MIKHASRGPRQAKLCTEKDGTIHASLTTQFVIAVVIPRDLFGFTREREIALRVLH